MNKNQVYIYTEERKDDFVVYFEKNDIDVYVNKRVNTLAKLLIVFKGAIVKEKKEC